MNPESNLIDFTQLGGYRLEQPTFEKLQSTNYLFLKALIGHFGIPDVGNYIISGCQISGSNITSGIMYIDGIVCPFEETAGTLATKIKRLETLQNLEFFNGTTPVVFRKYTAVVDASGTALGEFVRVPSPFNLPAGIVIDANYVHTDNNFTTLLLNKLLGIEAGAQVNVRPNWQQNNPTAANYIEGKPEGNLTTYLAKGNHIIGDLIGGTDVITIPLGTNVGTDEYHVSGDLMGTHPGTDAGEVKCNFITKRKTNVSFDIVITDYANVGSQVLEFSFYALPL